MSVPKRLEPVRDGQADPAEPEDADARAGDPAGQRRRTTGGPLAASDEPVRGGEPAHHVDDQAHGGVGDAVGQHVRGVATRRPRGGWPRRRRSRRSRRRSSRSPPARAAGPGARRARPRRRSSPPLAPRPPPPASSSVELTSAVVLLQPSHQLGAERAHHDDCRVLHSSTLGTGGGHRPLPIRHGTRCSGPDHWEHGRPHGPADRLRHHPGGHRSRRRARARGGPRPRAPSAPWARSRSSSPRRP